MEIISMGRSQDDLHFKDNCQRKENRISKLFMTKIQKLFLLMEAAMLCHHVFTVVYELTLPLMIITVAAPLDVTES